MEYSGSIVVYAAGGGFLLGLVLEEKGNRLQVRTPQGRVERVAVRRILAGMDARAGESPEAALHRCEQAVEKLRADIDVELLWESLPDQGSPTGVRELSEEYFGEALPEQSAAMARALEEHPTLFRRQANDFMRRTAQERDRIEQKQRRDAEEKRCREVALSELGALLAAGSPEAVAISDPTAHVLRLVENYLLHAQENHAVGYLKELRPTQEPRQTALHVLRCAKRLPDDADPHLLLNAVVADFPPSAENHARGVCPYRPDSEDRVDLSRATTVALDDADTREVDDAFSVEATEDGWRVGIHVADPSHFVLRDDPVDRAAAERVLTLYLPTTVVTMLPESLGCNVASLTPGAVRPALTLEVDLDAGFQAQRTRFLLTQVELAHRATYEEADALLAGASGRQPLAEALHVLERFTEALRNEREDHGAVRLIRPEFKIRVDGGEVLVKRLDPMSASRRLVSELMILFNAEAAVFGLRHDIPVIYRTQDPPTGSVPLMEAYDPVVFSNAVRNLRKSRLSTHPQRHHGLGLDLYTQVTSPLRRYADLVMHRQLAAALCGEPCPYTTAELIETLGAADAAETRYRQIEREVNQHWMLEHIRRTAMDRPHEAIVVPGPERRTLAELTEYGVRGLLAGRSQAPVGAHLTVRIQDIQPENGRLLLQQ